MKEKKCLSIQDYSCLGRCSLTVALVILSACKINTIALPTTVFSNHTAFKSYCSVPLTDKLEELSSYWEKYNQHFNAIYTGYLTTEQIPHVLNIISNFKKEDTKVIVDPACGDDGNLYAGFESCHINELRKLVKSADIICPNMTEACLLSNEKYENEFYNEDKVKFISIKLANLGVKKVIITGLLFENNMVGCSIYDSITKEYKIYKTECYPGKYHGAGDCFASCLTGALLNGIDIYNSVKIAHDFVHRAIKQTLLNQVDGYLYGLEFESVLDTLIQDINNKEKNPIK